jgi:pyruvate,water dikinase
MEIIDRVVRQTKEIAKVYRRPVDLEWVYDGNEVTWVQLREITSLNIPLYSNRISKEVFPGIIEPLIWSVNVPLVNGAWMAMLTELIGPNDIEPESLAGYFYSRAYFDIGAFGRILELLGLPAESLELLLGIEVEGPERPAFKPVPGMYRHLPRMLRFGFAKATFGRQIDTFLPTMDRNFRALMDDQDRDSSEEQLIEEIDQLFPLAQEAAYYNIVTSLMMHLYHRILKEQLGRIDIDFENLDLTADLPELDRFEPTAHLARLHQTYNELDEDLRARIQSGGYETLSDLPGTETLQHDLAEFLEQFGHLSDSSSDFSHEPWRENPALVLQMVINYATFRGDSPSKVTFDDLPLPAVRRPFFKWLFERARRFRWYREAVSSVYTFGYGVFRERFLALGDRFVQRRILARSDDIFYLYLDEIRGIVHAGDRAHDCSALIRERKAEIDRVRDITPPDIIYGDQPPPLSDSAGTGWKGIPTSRGHYVGRTRILRGIQDLTKMQDGDVLVIPYSDVGWTPLFTRAGAVIAESGGILSHSSIIAREYGIPAVVSVPGACQMADGTLVTVDGYRGEIIVHESGPG